MIEELKSSEKLHEDVDNFLKAYNTLPPDGRVAFLVSLDKSIKDKSSTDKRIYIALLNAAQNGKNIDETIEEMDKARRGEIE